MTRIIHGYASHKRYDTPLSIIIRNTIQITKTQTKDKIPSMEPIFANITLNHKLITVIRLSTQTVNSFHRHFQLFEYTTRQHREHGQ